MFHNVARYLLELQVLLSPPLSAYFTGICHCEEFMWHWRLSSDPCTCSKSRPSTELYPQLLSVSSYILSNVLISSGSFDKIQWMEWIKWQIFTFQFWRSFNSPSRGWQIWLWWRVVPWFIKKKSPILLIHNMSFYVVWSLVSPWRASAQPWEFHSHNYISPKSLALSVGSI